MEDMVLDTVLILWDMVMAILATLLLATVMDMVLAMALMDMESAMLMLSRRLMPMLSTELMEDMVLDYGCPLRRINQRYLLATSAKVDLAGVAVPENVNDKYFARVKAEKAAKKEGDIFDAKKEAYKPSEQ